MSRNAAYNYDSVAYKRDGYAYAEPAPSRQPTRRVDVIPGGAHGRAADKSPAHSLAVKMAKATVAAAVVFAGVGFGRITLSAATVAEALEAREVSSQLETARSSISDLEVQQSSLSNPTRIKNEAAALGMSSPEATSVIDLSGDIVATDEQGNLSLSGSMKALCGSPAEG